MSLVASSRGERFEPAHTQSRKEGSREVSGSASASKTCTVYISVSKSIKGWLNKERLKTKRKQ